MEKIIQIVNNPWVIGLVVGFVVAWISSVLFSKSDNKEYRQKIVTANQEILYAVRQGVPDGKLASLEMLRSLVAATASKYSVEEYDLYKPRDVADHLIKEVMDSSFIAVDIRNQYCGALADLKNQDIKSQRIKDEKERKDYLSVHQRRLRLVSSAMLGVMTAAMTVVINIEKNGDGNAISVLAPSLAFAVIVITSTLMFLQHVKRMERGSSSREERLSNTVDDEGQNT